MHLVNSYRFAGGIPFTQFGKYTESEFDDLIFIDGYVPVATVAEMDALRNTISQTMGLGTKYENTYTTGTDKKYVLYQPLDFTSFGTFTSFTGWTGIFDGNEVSISNLDLNDSLFSTTLLAGAEVLNYRGDITLNTTLSSVGAITAQLNGGLLTNNKITIDFTTTAINSGGLLFSLTSGTITDCEVNGTMDVTASSGGICGLQDGGTIEKSKVNLTITANGSNVGGISGRSNVGVVSECATFGSLTNSGVSVFYTSGGISECYIPVNDCYSQMAITANSCTYVGGLIGRNRSGGIITDCYSTGAVSGSAEVGGLIGRNDAAGVVNTSYYDTTTSGQSDTGKGDPKTTSEMQNGAIPDVSIYVGWSNLIWDPVDNSSYPELISLQ
jgi:hypothetical protein